MNKRAYHLWEKVLLSCKALVCFLFIHFEGEIFWSSYIFLTLNHGYKRSRNWVKKPTLNRHFLTKSKNHPTTRAIPKYVWKCEFHSQWKNIHNICTSSTLNHSQVYAHHSSCCICHPSRTVLKLADKLDSKIIWDKQNQGDRT